MQMFHAYGIACKTGVSVLSLTGAGNVRVYGWDTVIQIPNVLTHTFLSDLNLSANNAGPWTATGVVFGTVAGNAFTLDHDDINWGSVPTTDVRALLYVIWTGSAATSYLAFLHEIVPTKAQIIALPTLGAGRA